MANLEKHRKSPLEERDRADFSDVPTCGRSPHLVGRYIKNRPTPAHAHVLAREQRPQPVLLRLEATPATAQNLDRVRQRIRELNRRLAAAGTPFRLRVM